MYRGPADRRRGNYKLLEGDFVIPYTMLRNVNVHTKVHIIRGSLEVCFIRFRYRGQILKMIRCVQVYCMFCGVSLVLYITGGAQIVLVSRNNSTMGYTF